MTSHSVSALYRTFVKTVSPGLEVVFAVHIIVTAIGFIWPLKQFSLHYVELELVKVLRLDPFEHVITSGYDITRMHRHVKVIGIILHYIIFDCENSCWIVSIIVINLIINLKIPLHKYKSFKNIFLFRLNPHSWSRLQCPIKVMK